MDKLPDNLREFDDTVKTRELIYGNVLKAVSSRFPVEDEEYRLELGNPHYAGPQDYSLEQQKQALMRNRYLHTPIKGTWRLVHKASNAVLDEREDTVLNVPYYTDRGTIIYNGNEYSVVNQSRLKPGAYIRKQRTGEIESHFNVRPGTGKSFRIHLEPETGIFKLNVGQANIPVYPLMQMMGVTDKELSNTWGPELLAANIQKQDKRAIQKMYERFSGYKYDPQLPEADQIKYIAESLPKFQLDPDVVARTLGLQGVAGVTAPVLVRATQKMLGVSRGEEESDDRDAPTYSNILAIEDLLQERIDKDAGRLSKSLLYKIRRDRTLKRLGRGALNPYILGRNGFLLSSRLTMPLEETNPLHTLEQTGRITKLGEGGISSAESITDEARDVNNGQFGFIDPITGPEGLNIGIDTRAAYRTFKGTDQNLYGEFKQAGTGKMAYLRPDQVADVPVAFPGEMSKEGPTAAVMYKGRMQRVPKSEVQYEVPSIGHMMSSNTNLNPMPTGVQPGRQFYGAKFWSQYLPQVKGEVPLVDSLSPDGKNTFSEYYGRRIGTMQSKVGGTVVKVTDNAVVIKDDNGETHEIETIKDFPFNRLSVTGDTPVFIRDRRGIVLRLCIRDYVHCAGDEVLSYDPATKCSAWRLITGFTAHENNKRLYRVSFQSGRHVDVTEDHSLLTLDDTFNLVPVYPLDCVTGRTRCPVVFGTADANAAWDYATGVLDGLYLSEGSISQSQRGLLRIAVQPVDRQAYVRELVEGLGYAPHKQQPGAVGWTSHTLAERWETDFGHLAEHKHISGHVYGRGREYLSGLIAGYMGGDGCLNADCNGAIQVCGGSVSRELQLGLISVLNLLGVFATYTGPKPNGEGCFDIYKFRVRSSDLRKLACWFCYPDRQSKFEELVSDSYRADTFDRIPVTREARKSLYASFQGKVPHFVYKSAGEYSVSKLRLSECTGVVGRWGCSDVLWDTVEDITRIAHQDTVYDFSVEGSEAFALADGLMVHNTGITYTPTVKPGDKVNVGDMVAHSNFTDSKTGSINMGQNLKTAVLPARGMSVAGDTPVFWRRPDGTYTYGAIAGVPTGTGMRSLALDVDTWDCRELGVHSWMIHAPDSPMLRVCTCDGMEVRATESHSFVGFFGDAVRECTVGELLESGALVPVVQPVVPFDSGDRVVICTSEAGVAASREFTLDREFGWVIGMYLAEGCCIYRNGCAHHISWAVTEPELIARMEQFFAVRGIHTRTDIRKTDDGLTGAVTVCSAAMAQWFATNCGRYAWFKHMPDCLWTAPVEFAEGVIDGYFCGDGTVSDKQCTATTTSRLLADGLAFLLAALGVRATYREYPNGKLAKRPAYLLHVFHEFLQGFPTLSLKRKHAAIERLRARKVKFSRDRIPIPGSELPIIRKLFKHRLPKDQYVSRSLLQRHYLELPPRIKALVDAPVWWDYVKQVEPCASEEYVYDLDMRPLGNFVIGGGWVLHNSYEDAYVISESAAKKLSTQRLYGFDAESRNGVKIGKNKYISAFPKDFTKDQIAKIGDDGVVQKGTVLHKGDPIILAVGPKLLTSADAQLGKLHKVLRNAQTNKSVVWEHDYPGTVTDAAVMASGVKVNVRSEPAVGVGDKLSTRYGLKGVVGKIVPDSEMPKDPATGASYELLMNPMGILSRVAPAQLIELQLAKLAKRTGKQVRLPQSPPPEGWATWAEKQLADAGISEVNDILDTVTGKTIKGVADGYVYTSAFHHLADKKLSQRGEQGSYTMDEQPAKGGPEGAKRFSMMDVNATLAHGATAVVKDAMTIRGTRNEDYWKALRMGRPLPEPKVPFIYDKFLNTLKAGGINIIDKGDIMSLMPMTDDDVKQLSKGGISSSKQVDPDFNPINGGLFDMGKTGGTMGNRWTHVDLVEPVPNPVMEEPIRRLLGLREQDLRTIVGGGEVNGIVGNAGLKKTLADMDIDAEIAKHLEKVQKLRGANRDNSVKALGYLTAAKKQGVHPSRWMISKVPILPPMFRPIARMGDTPLVADMNELYQHMIDQNNNIRDLRNELPDTELSDEKLTLYDSVAAAYGLGDPITAEGQSKRLKGAIRQIIGTNPKGGMFQSKVISKTVGGVGRGVVTPDPNLDMDSIGIPPDSAWKLYQDFVMRRLVRKGYPATRALEMIQNRDPAAKDMLDQEMQTRPVLVNRAPVWHKFNLLAFYPHIAEGNTIRVSPLITKGFTMDFDGDQANFHVPVSDKAMEQAKQKMLPSKNLFSLTDLRSIRHAPTMEMTLGLYWLTRGMTNKPVQRFATLRDAQAAYTEGKIALNDPIEIG